MLKNLVLLLVGVLLGWFVRGQFNTEVMPLLTLEDSLRFERPVKLTINDSIDIDQNTGFGSNELEQLNAYLNEKKYDMAFEIIEGFRQQDDSTMLEQSKVLIKKYTRKFWVDKDYLSAIQILRRYLVVSNRNVEIRLLLVESYSRSGKYLTAIDELYLAKGHASTQSEIENIDKKIRLLVDKQSNVFNSGSFYNEKLNFFEKLTQQEADFAPYFISLAETQIQLGHDENARASLQMILEDKNVGHQARELLNKLNKSLVSDGEVISSEQDEVDGVSSIRLINKGNHYYLEASANSVSSIRLLIDTGASMTIFTPQILKRFNPPLKETGETRLFSTANGMVEAKIYKLNELIIGDMEVSDINIAVLDMQSSHSAEGLLGMNFLQYFQFYIDQDNKLLHLSLRQ